jgi:hypothetical protein
MSWPRLKLPALRVSPEDRVAIIGLVTLSAGVWGRWGWEPAAMVFGALLLVAYAVPELIELIGGKV